MLRRLHRDDPDGLCPIHRIGASARIVTGPPSLRPRRLAGSGRLAGLTTIMLAGLCAGAHAQPAIEADTPEAAMVEMMEEHDCMTTDEKMFAVLMEEGLDVDSAQFVIATWASRGWIVWDGARFYVLGGVGECG